MSLVKAADLKAAVSQKDAILAAGPDRCVMRKKLFLEIFPRLSPVWLAAAGAK